MPLTILTRRTRGGSCPTPRPKLACRLSASRLSENLARAVSRHPSKSDWPPTEWPGWNVSLRLGIAIAKARFEVPDIAIQSKSARTRGKNNSRRSGNRTLCGASFGYASQTGPELNVQGHRDLTAGA